MNIDRSATSSGVPLGTLIVLMLAVFTVSVGFGVVLPLLPGLIASLLAVGGSDRSIATNTGLLTSTYVLALFLFAPLWGRASDRHGRRIILLVGMIGFAGSILMSTFVSTLTSLYAERFVSGFFAAAVTPVAAATIGDLAASDEARGQRLTMVSIAGIAGFLVGPMLGLLLARLSSGQAVVASPEAILATPLVATGLFAIPVTMAIFFTIPHATHISANRMNVFADASRHKLVNRLLVLALMVSAAVGVFEVGLALRGSRELGLDRSQIAIMFTECSLVMIIVQTLVFSPLVTPSSTRFLITPALAILAAGLFLVPFASNFTLMLVVIGAVAASAGILLPIITYWISVKAGNAQGAELGKQTSAASLGSAFGSAAGGFLFEIPIAGSSFFAITAVTIIGIALSLGLPRSLASHLSIGSRQKEWAGAADRQTRSFAALKEQEKQDTAP